MNGLADVVVGGGIAGSSLATVLARDGYQVVVLERQTSYRDKVRGEALSCWGVAELLQLDLEKPLLDAGGCYVTRRSGPSHSAARRADRHRCHAQRVGLVCGSLRRLGEERRERMRRLRVAARVITDIAATFTPAGAARRRAYNAVWQTDPLLGGPKLITQVGPENVPADSFTQSTIDRILALA